MNPALKRVFGSMKRATALHSILSAAYASIRISRFNKSMETKAR